ncbi:MAG: glycosyltransferase family 4 protein [Nitrospirota bacterium]
MDFVEDITRPPLQSHALKACRLLYVVGQLGLGGLERQLFYLLKTMDRQRYRPIVAVWDYREKDPYVQEFQRLHVPVLGLGDKPSRMEKLAAFRRMVSQFQPEVVHSYTFHTNFAAWWATLGSTVLPLGSVRNSFLFDRQTTGTVLGRMCARWPHVQICNSVAAKYTAEHCATMFKAGRLCVVRNSLDLSYFSPRPFPQKITLLAVGSLYQRKRWDRLIMSLSLLSTRGIRFHVRHVGEGPLRGELEDLAKRVGVAGLIQFLGARNDIPELLADSAFLVHTAEDEGCPNVVMEAMACGRAVVAMDAGDIPFLVEDGKTGFVVSRGDVTRFAERVFQLLTDNDLRNRMSLAAREKAERELGLDRLISETLAVYKSAGWKDARVGVSL